MYLPIKAEVITSASISSSESPFPPLIFTQIVEVIQLQLSLLLLMALQKRKEKFVTKKKISEKTKSQLLASRKDGSTYYVIINMLSILVTGTFKHLDRKIQNLIQRGLVCLEIKVTLLQLH